MEPELLHALAASRRRAQAVPGSSPMARVADLGAEEMKFMYALEMWNKNLRGELGILDADPIPHVDEQVQEHVESLRQEMCQRYALKTELQIVYKELDMTNASLTEEQRLLVTGASSALGSAAVAVPAVGSLSGEDPAERQELAESAMVEIQNVTDRNIELINDYDARIKVLEEELASVRWHSQVLAFSPKPAPREPSLPGQDGCFEAAAGDRVEALFDGAWYRGSVTSKDGAQYMVQCDADPQGTLTPAVETRRLVPSSEEHSAALARGTEHLRVLEQNCEELESSIAQELSRRREADGRLIQQLQVEQDAAWAEISNLNQSLRRGASDNAPGSTGAGKNSSSSSGGVTALQQDVEHLRLTVQQSEDTRCSDQQAVEQQAYELRREMEGLQEDKRRAEEQKLEVEGELEELRRVQTGASALEREFSDLQQARESATKEMTRAQHRIEVSNVKIRELTEEHDDLRQRARCAAPTPSSSQCLSAGGGQAAPALNGRYATTPSQVSDLQDICNKLQQKVQMAKQREESKWRERDEALAEIDRVQLEARTTEQMMRLLKSRTLQSMGGKLED